MKTALLVLLAAVSFGQVRPVGALTSVDLDTKKLTMKADSGQDLTIVIDDSTSAVKVKPGERDLTGATPLKLSELAKGDRILVRGSATGADGLTFAARQIIVMSQSELAAKQNADKADWERRGVFGVVKSVDAAARSVTIETRGAMGQPAKSTAIQLTPSTVIRRYAPDSVKFSDALPGAIGDIQPGDQVRARGDRSTDGSTLTASEVVSGTFRNIAAQVVAVDAANSALTVTDLDTKKQLTVRISPDSSVRKLPEMMAQFMAMRMNAGSGPMPAGAPAMPMRGGPGAPGTGGPGGMGGGPPNPSQMLERMPPLKLTDLKTGDALIIASTAGKSGDSVTAITVLAGVEPILTAPSKNRQMMLGSWNVDMGGGLGMSMQ